MKIRKIICVLILLILIIGSSFASEYISVSEIESIIQTSGVTGGEVPQIQSRSAVILDRTSSEIIWGKNEHEKTPMASTTNVVSYVG